MAYKYIQGHKFDSRMYYILKEAQRLAGIPFNITQGSYNRSYSTSAGTHSGPGAVDLSVRGLSRSQIEKIVKSLRTVGVAAWYRSSDEGPWAPHIHGIAVGTKGLPGVAYRQTLSYKNGRSGLASNRADRHAYMKVPYRTWEQYVKTKSSPKPANKSWKWYLKNGVDYRQLKRGRSGEHVKAYQHALRAYLWKNKINPNKYNKTGVTGYFGSETSKLQSVVQWNIYRKTGDKGWTKINTDGANPSVMKRIGLNPRP